MKLDIEACRFQESKDQQIARVHIKSIDIRQIESVPFNWARTSSRRKYCSRSTKKWNVNQGSHADFKIVSQPWASRLLCVLIDLEFSLPWRYASSQRASFNLETEGTAWQGTNNIVLMDVLWADCNVTTHLNLRRYLYCLIWRVNCRKIERHRRWWDGDKTGARF